MESCPRKLAISKETSLCCLRRWHSLFLQPEAEVLRHLCNVSETQPPLRWVCNVLGALVSPLPDSPDGPGWLHLFPRTTTTQKDYTTFIGNVSETKRVDFKSQEREDLKTLSDPGGKRGSKCASCPPHSLNGRHVSLDVCLESACWGRNTPFNRHETEEQLGVTETQQVTAEEEQDGSRLPGDVWLESELQIMRKHPVSRIATISYEGRCWQLHKGRREGRSVWECQPRARRLPTNCQVPTIVQTARGGGESQQSGARGLCSLPHPSFWKRTGSRALGKQDASHAPPFRSAPQTSPFLSVSCTTWFLWIQCDFPIIFIPSGQENLIKSSQLIYILRY